MTNPEILLSSRPALSPLWDLDAGGPSFQLDPEVAHGLIGACDSYLLVLEGALGMVGGVSDVKCMGSLTSAENLAGKFSKKAVGGEDSLEKALKSHVQVVTEMRDFFQKCLDSYNGVDTSNAVTLAGQDLLGS
ncbi:hypothetical protein [Rhodococcus erythropolis]|uniref:hypothetical protein n=2 Tax=Rhodococcus erythropolis group TaxID=2840174 RepID=UPI001CD93F61|nr:hypothetical protein [Rhodococcus erythropolis]